MLELTLARAGFTTVGRNEGKRPAGLRAFAQQRRHPAGGATTSNRPRKNWQPRTKPAGSCTSSAIRRAAFSPPTPCRCWPTWACRSRACSFSPPPSASTPSSNCCCPVWKSGQTPLPSLYLLSDKLERGDSVGPYGKSLLYLVSNAFEGTREVPILGMKACLDADKSLSKLFGGASRWPPCAGRVGGHPDRSCQGKCRHPARRIRQPQPWRVRQRHCHHELGAHPRAWQGTPTSLHVTRSELLDQANDLP